MTGDQIIGVAILEVGGAYEKLHVICENGGGNRAGRRFVQTIAAYRAGTPKPCEPAWQYTETGDTLAMQPSLCMKHMLTPGVWTEYWHNPGTWSVKFKRMEMVPGDPGMAYQTLCDANPGWSAPNRI